MSRKLLRILAVPATLLASAPALAENLPKPEFELASPGTETVVDYEKYGHFGNLGGPSYKYTTRDRKGLEQASGEGIYPDKSHLKDPAFEAFRAKHPEVNAWDFVDSGSNQDDFFAWCQSPKHDEGTKLFYEAEALRKAGHVAHALKAYYALLVYFPKTAAWSRDGSYYWYVGPEAVARIRKLCATYPDLGLELEGARFDVDSGATTKMDDDIVSVDPGRFARHAPSAIPRSEFRVTAERGKGRVRLAKYNDRYWELLVDGKPFFVKGVTYTCTTVGESAHALNVRPWMTLDDDKNGANDGMFDSWVDKNGNNRQDADEPAVGDARLLEEMGANTVRVYHLVTGQGEYDPREYDKELMRKLHREHGIFFVMGDFLGAYTVGSDARWDIGTDYTAEEDCANMKRVVRDMVLDHKDEPYVLMWLLGNENQHPHTKTNAHTHPKEYAEFVNEIAGMIHELDPDHPVAVCNLQTAGLKELARYAPEIDVYGSNVYSGAYSMGSVWHSVRQIYDRPVLLTEMGSDAYAEGKGADEESQAEYFRQNWKDIELNSPGQRGEGNAIGGLLFEWMDEWWKSSKGNGWGDPEIHNTEGDSPNAPFHDGWFHEEWFGIFGQGDGKKSPFLREPRRVYSAVQLAWSGGRPRRVEPARAENIEYLSSD